jgi:hypothetical protein
MLLFLILDSSSLLVFSTTIKAIFVLPDTVFVRSLNIANLEKTIFTMVEARVKMSRLLDS